MERFRRSPQALWRAAEHQVLVLPRGRQEPVILEGTGVALWAALDRPTTLPTLVATLAENFGADPASVERDVRPALDQLVALGVLEQVPGDA